MVTGDREPGSGQGSPEEVPGSAERRRLVRKAGLYAGGLFLAAVGVAAGGAALVAWLLAAVFEVSFWAIWAVLVAVLLGLPLAGHGLIALRERWKRGR